MLDLGVDGVMTDRPAMLRELLVERGQWRPGERSAVAASSERRPDERTCRRPVPPVLDPPRDGLSTLRP